ncbi:hypothetical protein SAMN02745218_01132 [Desulfofundulus australicus DSM 11792]|uniref:Uncharacterized protein n=1 Tax=Desulfofundulus australicus DSM 11792 TaxID=1121425 RepID=A0A1M4XQR9_9FIRM|nr:hypothetical protein [Desulfofundulus australicus]SHE95795.1 hypothetical protein SAMN02745218_01132 [Desulfofundulus australicus DSM 11792]
MLLEKGAITQLASEGHVTLQVPEFSIRIIGTKTIARDGMTWDVLVAEKTLYGPVEEYNEWFMRLKLNGRKHVPTRKDSAPLFLSEKGWKNNKGSIEEAFKGAIAKGVARGTWEDFEAMANEHFMQLNTLGYSTVFSRI